MENTYYHIRLDYYNNNLKVTQTVFLFDIIDIKTIKSDYITPYLTENKFTFSGVRLNGSNVNKMQIFHSNYPIKKCVDIANDKVSENIIFYYTPKDVLTYSDLVTEITESIIKEVERTLPSQKITEITSTFVSSSKSPLVFISHSSKDKGFVDDLVDLLESIGLNKNNLFCSSIPGYWIGLSQDIFKELLNLFTERKLYVIFVHSPRYYQSCVSMNEMGAAWVLKTEFCSFLTADMDYSKMVGVINSETIGIKCNADDVNYRLDEFKKQIIAFLQIPDIDLTIWERKKVRFLQSVNK